MLKYLIFTLILLQAGCGYRVYSDSTINELAQVNRDKTEMLIALAKATERTELANAIKGSLSKIDSLIYKTYGVDTPIASRVSWRDWIEDPTEAGKQQDTATDRSDKTIQNNAILGLAILPLLLVLMRILANAGGPVGAGLSVVTGMIGLGNPRLAEAKDKVLVGLEKFKETNPDWRENPVFDKISAVTNDKDKTLLKNKIRKLK